MNNNVVRNEGLILILIGGSILFGTGYFVPDEVALQVATFIGGLIGYIVYSRVSSWEISNQARKDTLMFGITVLISLWASLCWLAAYNVFPQTAPLAENRRNSFIILNFFFPMLIVFFGWVSKRLSRSR